MENVQGRLPRLVLSALILLLVVASPVAGHSGEGVSLEHVIVEIGSWALAVAGVIAAIVAVFWVRARLSRR